MFCSLQCRLLEPVVTGWQRTGAPDPAGAQALPLEVCTLCAEQAMCESPLPHQLRSCSFFSVAREHRGLGCQRVQGMVKHSVARIRRRSCAQVHSADLSAQLGAVSARCLQLERGGDLSGVFALYERDMQRLQGECAQLRQAALGDAGAELARSGGGSGDSWGGGDMAYFGTRRAVCCEALDAALLNRHSMCV